MSLGFADPRSIVPPRFDGVGALRVTKFTCYLFYKLLNIEPQTFLGGAMVQSKELVTLFNSYKKELGTYTESNVAATMVLAHVCLDLKRAVQKGVAINEAFAKFNGVIKDEPEPEQPKGV